MFIAIRLYLQQLPPFHLVDRHCNLNNMGLPMRRYIHTQDMAG